MKPKSITRIMSQVQLHLTGSRFFGTENPDSDWDYFCQDSPETRRLLESLGYEKEGEGAEGVNLKAVYRHPTENVHIQLRSQPEDMLVIQNAMKEFGLGPDLSDKSKAKRLFGFAYRVLGYDFV